MFNSLNYAPRDKNELINIVMTGNYSFDFSTPISAEGAMMLDFMLKREKQFRIPLANIVESNYFKQPQFCFSPIEVELVRRIN